MDRRLRTAAVALLGLAACGSAGSGSERVVVAVAANFAGTLATLSEAFEHETGLTVDAVSGSTGQLCAQIRNGAPFDVFLSADEERVGRLVAEGLAVEGSSFVYAIGRLALWAPHAEVGEDPQALLATARPLAIANPETAPYGRAARELLVARGLWAEEGMGIVRASDVGAAFAFVESGGAAAGLVALSQLVSSGRRPVWVVPSGEHAPIRQAAARLSGAEHEQQARRFLEFLDGEQARALLLEAGYEVPR